MHHYFNFLLTTDTLQSFASIKVASFLEALFNFVANYEF